MAHRPHPTKGKDWWYIIIREKGSRKQKYIPFKGSETEAAALDLEMQGRTAETEYPSINDLLPRFLPAYQNNSQPGSYDDMLVAMKKLLPHFGELRIPLLMPHHYEEYKTQRLADTYLPGRPAQKPEDDRPGEAAKRRHPSKRTINRELTYLQSMLRFAEELGIVIRHRPKLFPAKQTAPRATVVLSPEEIAAVLDQLQGNQRTLAHMMFWAGLRKNEALRLRVKDIDLSNNAIIVHGKGNKIRIVPILDASLASDIGQRIEDKRIELAKKRPGKTPGQIEKEMKESWLIVNPKTSQPYGSIMRALRTACTKVGVSKHVYHHLLRHTFGTAAMVSGMQQRAIQGMMGHSDSRTTEKYTHLAAQFLQAEGAKLTSLVGGGESQKQKSKGDFKSMVESETHE